MKDVFVGHSKDDKVIAKKLVSKLESSGVSCYIYTRDKGSGSEEDLISDTKIFIPILSESAQKSEDLIRQMKLAVEQQLHIIPFKNGPVDSGFSTEYLLHSLEWVDAYEDGFDEAYEILIEIFEEINEGKPAVQIPKKKKVKEEEFKLKQSHYLTIIGILGIVIIYLLFFNKGDNKINSDNNNLAVSNGAAPPDFIDSELKNEEKIIVGSWRMVDYQDSRILTPEEQVITDQNVEELKKRVLLKYNSDRSFERIGFTPQPQSGYWEYDPNKRIIYLTPAGTDKKEIINIFSLSDKEMTIIVTENVQNLQGKTEIVTTRITFNKQ